jgi:lysophospholipase L1-like esterase
MTYSRGVLEPNTTGLLINDCYINDIRGELSAQTDYDSNNKAIYRYFFEPINAMDTDVVLLESTPLITYASLNATLETDLAIIWVGTNDMARADVKNWVSDVVKQMISVQKSGKYIILGLTNLNYYLDSVDKLNDYNNTFKEIFGKHFIDVKQSFVDNGINKLIEYGITPSDGDRDMIVEGLIPSSFRNKESDGSISKVHFNNYGYKFIGELVYKKGIELGYWL